MFKRQALLASLPQLAKYRRTYTVAQIAANLAKVAPEGTDYAMYQAAEWGDATELLNLVELWFAHPVLNDCSGWGFTGDSTPLMVACWCGRIECVRVLVAQPGIELDKGSGYDQWTALLYASRFGHVDIVELLCSLPGIDCNKAGTDNGGTPYFWAGRSYSGSDKEERIRKIRAILEAKGARLTEHDLLCASMEGDVDLVQRISDLPDIDCNMAITYGRHPHSDACVDYSGSDKKERTRKIRAILEAKGAK